MLLSASFFYGKTGNYGIQGIGDGFIRAIAAEDDGSLHKSISEVVCVSTDEAKHQAQYIQKKYNYCLGMSSGAELRAAKIIADKYNFDAVVTVFADGSANYQSAGLNKSGSSICMHENYSQCLPSKENGCCCR